MSYTRFLHKTPLINEKNNVYETEGISFRILNKLLRSRFIGEGVYGIEKFSAPNYKEEYLITPSFDKKEGVSILKEWTFKNEEIKEISLFQLNLTKPLFMPLDTNVFIDLLNLIEDFPHGSVFTQILFCKRIDNWRETAISQYESFLKGNDRPLDGRFGIKCQEKILDVLTKLNNYSIQREQIEEMEQKILQSNYRFECRFLVYEQKYANHFLSFIENALIKLQSFNKFDIQKVSNKRNLLAYMEKRQFQMEFVNQLLSENEMYSLLCSNKPIEMQKVELEKPIKHVSITKNIEESKVTQITSHFMPVNEIKETQIDESKVQAINQAFKRVGIVKQPLEVKEMFQGSTLLKVQMEIPPEITYTSIKKKLEDIKGALGNTEISIEIGDKPDSINIFIPLDEREPLYFNTILKSEAFQQFKEQSILPFIIGENVNGGYIFADLTVLRHLLVAGTTGSGKSVFMNLIILCFILSVPPEQLMMYLIDPKMVEFTRFKEFPQVKDVVVDMRKANGLLTSLVVEMDSRYETFSKVGCRDIQSYNIKNEDKLPYIVCVIDELADLMMVNKSVEDDIVRLGQKARGAGIHLIIATQRPSVDVITGLIKANMPSRIAFAVTSGTDSKTIIDKGGAEKLLGRGDGLAKIEGNMKHEFERFQSPVLTLDSNEEDDIYEKLLGLFDGVVVEGELNEPEPELEPIDQLKRCIANTGELRVEKLGRLLEIGNSRVHAMMMELVEEEWLRKEGKGKPFEINIDEEELNRWRDEK